MRWLDNKIFISGIDANNRIESRFLWWPMKIGDETRWLEHASWYEHYEPRFSNWQKTGWHNE